MKLTEVQYAGKNEAQYTGLPAKKIIKLFFDWDEHESKEYAEEYEGSDYFHNANIFYPKSGLYVEDEYGEQINNLYVLKNGKIISVDHEQDGTQMDIDPSHLFVYRTQLVHKP